MITWRRSDRATRASTSGRDLESCSRVYGIAAGTRRLHVDRASTVIYTSSRAFDLSLLRSQSESVKVSASMRAGLMYSASKASPAQLRGKYA